MISLDLAFAFMSILMSYARFSHMKRLDIAGSLRTIERKLLRSSASNFSSQSSIASPNKVDYHNAREINTDAHIFFNWLVIIQNSLFNCFVVANTWNVGYHLKLLMFRLHTIYFFLFFICFYSVSKLFFFSVFLFICYVFKLVPVML